jgi:hypothetical protein
MAQLSRKTRFSILFRDGFQCLYCKSAPGIEKLEVDHLLPRSKFGSNNRQNLVTSCVKCNNFKSDQILFPTSFYIGLEDCDGFRPCKKFGYGTWIAMVNPHSLVIENYQRDKYWIGHDRVWTVDWKRHIMEKRWSTEEIVDCFEAVDWLKKMVAKPKNAVKTIKT